MARKKKNRDFAFTIEEVSERLQPYFQDNPYSTVEVAENEHGLEIVRPWGDASLVLDIDENFEELAKSLNKVVLPEKLSAVWHKENTSLEVIWTAFKLPKSQAELQEREFEFNYEGKVHKCKFGLSSEELIVIAKQAKPRTISDTNHRNTQFFTYISKFPEKKGESFDKARSFWISDVEWNESKVVELIRHLNFYMTYFDGLSPTVLIHSTNQEPIVPKRARYIREDFPKRIDCSNLDENLLSFWSFADSGNPMLRFLLYYRILEYSAYHFVSDDIRENLRKILLSPDLRSNMNSSIGAMMSAMGSSKLSDAQRLRSLARRALSPSLIWRDLSANFDFFTKDTHFDGGFSVRAPIGKNDKEASFDVNGVERVIDRCRDIRNALSHGKDQESAGVIRPTPQNVNLFRPWVHLIATAAGEVVLYGNNL